MPLNKSALLAVAFAATSLEAQTPRGYWQTRYDRSDDRVQLTFEDYDYHNRRSGSTGYEVMPSELHGVTRSQLMDGDGPVKFTLARDAGTFYFDGQVYRGHGTGSFTFTPSATFAGQMTSRGYRRPSAEQQFLMAMHDVGLAMVDELRRQGYNRPTVEDLVMMGMHGVRYDYVRGMSDLGIRLTDTDDLVQMRDHGVTPDYIRALARLGYTRLSTDDLLTARDHGVTPDMAEGFRRLGYTRLSLEDLVRLRDHGVTLNFAERVRERDSTITIDELIRMRDRGDR
jgi:hypothetical protein